METDLTALKNAIDQVRKDLGELEAQLPNWNGENLAGAKKPRAVARRLVLAAQRLEALTKENTLTLTREIDQVGASIYLSEIWQLTDSLLHRIEILECAQHEWMHHLEVATAAATGGPGDFPHGDFNAAIRASVEEQGVIFEAVEALFSAWARLSLLVHPESGHGTLATWRERRGATLRGLLALPDDSPLAQRGFRNAWMHFDERLDEAYKSGWLGNRQQFVRRSDVAAALKHSVRVIDVEAMVFYFRTQSDEIRSIRLSEMKSVLQDLLSGRERVPDRLEALPKPPGAG